MKRNNNPQRKYFPNKRLNLIGVFLIAFMTMFVLTQLPKAKPVESVSLSEVAAGIAAGSIVKIIDAPVTGEYTIHYQNGRVERGARDVRTSLLEQLSLLGVQGEQLAKIHYDIVKHAPSTFNTPGGMLLIAGLIGVPLSVAYYMNKKDRWGNKKAYSEADIPAVQFKDVAGLDENLQELRDIVTFLREGNKYAEVGAKLPRGVLMVGDPGTGKTLMAKAIAGEAGVPFFAMSGSEFVEVFVGVGASRMRSLFQKARKKAPCIIFIDEIDAVGRERHRSESGAEMEQDQTLNQLLVEMDGFDSSEGVIVLAATNRVDVLDSALTRPGRFDRRIYVHRPDIRGRAAILGIHVNGIRLAPDVDLSNVAKATPGLAGADLANIVNEAAITAVRNGHTEVYMRDFDDAIEKTLAGGVQRTSHVMSEDERRIVAYHEAGHAVVMHATELSDPVYKITIIPRGLAGGYTMALPEQDSLLISRRKILARITGLLGGRAAEEIFFQDITNGASNDLNVATQLAEEMVMRLGMDHQAGLRVFAPPGRAAFAAFQSSQKTFETIDEGVKNILDACYTEARNILLEKRPYVERIALELLNVETLNQEQFNELMNQSLAAPETL